MFSVKVNGSLAGYFGSSRGLRQGDPLSPYLFVLIMEMLSLKLNWGTSQQGFNFHWRAKDCKISHLFFADDILIFCHANLQSVAIVQSCINSFSLYSGLIPNIQKSHCFLANTDSTTAQSILSLLGYSPGSLPTKFLGVPLISSKLSYQNCVPLIHRITQRVTSWTSKALAYSGRLQLIKSVLFSIQSFWSAHFILPKAVIRSIQSILCRFLWKGTSLAKFGAKVAWKTLSHPTNEGGLGIKNILDWNQSLILLHLIHVIQFNTSSLWASWIKATVLKGQSFWQKSIPNDCSWIWKQVLKLRPIALQHIIYKVGKGDRISLWFDPWLHRTSINPSPNLLSNSGLSATATVADIIQNGTWSLPYSNHHDVIMFRSHFATLPAPPQVDDCILWDSLNINNLKARQIWDCIRQRRQVVSWHTITWNKLSVPRYSFMLWLGFHKKIQTNDITKSYTGRIMACPLCQSHPETFDHLFFLCDYSAIILQTALNMGNWHTAPLDWTGITDFITHFQGRKLSKLILSLSLAVSFYKIWEARNKKLHSEVLIPPSRLAQDVIHIIKSRLSKCNTFIKAANSCTYYCHWLLL